MTRLRAAAAARLALRATASSSSPGFGSVAPRSNSYAPVSCFVPFSRLTGSLRDCTIRFSLEELQFEWERDPSSADHWIDAVAGVGSSADHCVDPVADAPSFGQILEEDIQLPLLIKAYEVRARIMNKASSFGLEDRPFPDRCYRRNRADLEKEFSYGVSVMPGAHFEKFRALSPHRPLNCHLDDRVCCDWFWKPDAAAVLSMPPKIGDVSDEELLDLLNLAFASDAATIVRRARELLSSKVDPLQLLDQLTNLIMDILAAKHPSDSSEVRRVTGRHTSADVDVHKLKNALEILSETEKQLKTTKNQSTWLTAALLQFNMREPCCLDDIAVSSMFTESQTDVGTAILKDESLDTSSHLCCQNKVGSLDMNLGHQDVLEMIWMKALENCSSRPLQNLLRKDGKLSSLYTSQGVAVAELQFCHPEDVPTSETFWKPLCASLQNLLKCNVDIRINLSPIFSNRMDTESRILSYQKISVVPAASTPGNAPMKAGGDTSKMTPSTGRGSSIKFRWQAASNSSSVGLGLVSSSTRLHGGRNIVMTPCRGYCTNLELPTEKIPPPREWLVPVFEESQMWRAFPPDSFRSESALLMKTVRGVIPHMCTDESTFLLNYDPYAYVKARPLFRREVIHGAKIDTSGDKPFIWLPYDHALYLLQSLPLLARFFHEQGLCLPRLTLNDLAITGAGTFRLRGAPTSIKFRERTPGNIRDVYSNIRSLLMELVVASVGPDILVELPSELHSLFQLMDDGFKNEYLICFNSFFIPLSNKSSALLRIIDAILELPLKNNKILKLLLKSVYTVKWQDTVKSNAYLTRWFRFRRYGEGRREFILYLRVTICHKLEHGLPDKFVDFLVYATFQNVLMGLQKTLSDIGRLRDFHMEELYLHNARPGFVPFIDESLIAAGGSRDGTSIEVLYHSYLRRMQQGKRGVMVFHHGRRKLQNSVLAKLKLHGEGTVQGQE